MYDTSDSDEEEGATDLFGGSGGMGEAASLALLVSLTLCFVLLVVFVTIMYLRFKKREDKEKKSKQRYHRTAMSDPDVGALFGSGGLGSGFGNTLSELIEQSSGSGSGLPLLVQRTIAKQVNRFFSRFFGNASKWTFRNLEFLKDFGFEFLKNP